MNQNDRDPFEKNLTKIARDFKYPSTPNIAAGVRARLDSARLQRTFSWKAVTAVVLLALLIAFFVPAVRARLADFLQIGIVRIFQATVTPTPADTANPTGSPPVPTATLTPLLKLEGKTTLADARKKAGFPILIPAYPPELGLPDIVYQQDKANMVVLVWLSPSDPQKVRMSLHEIGPNSIVLKKMDPKVVQETNVGSHYALWTTGPYMVQVTGPDDYDYLRLVEGHTLIWAIGQITYRLETDLELDEALKIAESLH